MSFTVTHTFVSAIADGADATRIRPSNWNANHTVTWLTTTVGALPAATTVGQRYFVTDATASSFGATVAAGGSTKYPVYADGTNWKIG